MHLAFAFGILVSWQSARTFRHNVAEMLRNEAGELAPKRESPPDDVTKSRCSEKPKFGSPSCEDSWRISSGFFGIGDSSARCAWVDEMCVPNCLHEENQHEWLCEASFCLWNSKAGTCTFDPLKAASRRKFCDSTAGSVDRRFVDAEGKQPDFYDHNFPADDADNKQKLFCRGLLGDDDDQHVADGKDPASELLATATRCWKPSPENRALYEDAATQAAMKAEIASLLDPLGYWPELPMFPTIMENPLVAFIGGNVGPNHYTIGLTNSHRMEGVPPNPPTSYCQEFDYTASSNGTVDAAGCRLFKASFQPMQALVRCIMPLVREDRYKQLWHKVAEAAENNPNASAAAHQALREDKHVEWLLTELRTEGRNGWNEGSLGYMVLQWMECRKNGACTRWFDEFERAAEIMKQVELDSWEGLDQDGIRELLRKRILSPLAAPAASNPPALQESTVDSIIGQCFHQTAQPNHHSLYLKESLRCLPLMWDFVQIPALPQTALWMRKWPEKVHQEFRHVHPLCGRLALAPLARSFSRSKYPLNWKLLRFNRFTSNKCLTETGAHCINFKDCWAKFLTKHVGIAHDFCAPASCCCRDYSAENASKGRLKMKSLVKKHQCMKKKGKTGILTCCVVDHDGCRYGYKEASHAQCAGFKKGDAITDKAMWRK